MEQAKMGIREYVAIAVFVISMKLTDDVPSILYQNLLNAAWMAPIIMGIIAVIPIYLSIKVILLYEGKSLLDIIVHLFGKYIGFVVLFLLFIILSLSIIVQSAIYTDIVKTMYFTQTPSLAIYAILMGVSAYGASKGPMQIGSVAWLFLPYVKISLFLCLFLSIGYGHIDFLFPIMGPGLWEIIKESSIHLSIYMDFFYLCMLIPHIRNVKVLKKGTWVALIILVIEMVIAIAAYIVLFDFTIIKLINYPLHEAIHFLPIGFLKNIEMFFFPFWLIATFVRFAVYLYLNAVLFGKVFKINRFEFIIPTVATLIIFIGLIPDSPSYNLLGLRAKLIHYSTPVFFILPFILWILAKFRGDFNNEKTK